MESFDYVLHEGHVIVEVHGARALLDTGSPVSFGRRPVRLGGTVHDLPSGLGPLDIDKTQEFVGTALDVLLGGDLLGLGDFAIEPETCRFVFGDERPPSGIALDARFVMGIPLLAAEVAGSPRDLVLDTGAPLNYLVAPLPQGAASAGRVRDFHVTAGRCEVETVRVEVALAGRARALRFAAAPPGVEAILRAAGAEGIVGTELLETFGLRVSARAGKVWLRPRAPAGPRSPALPP